MNSYNENYTQTNSSSSIAWIISLILLLSSLSGWYFYLQADNDYKKSQKQKQRIQKQYSQKADELYESWDKVQQKQDKNYQLMMKVDKCKLETTLLKNKLGQNTQENSELSSCQESLSKAHSDFKNKRLVTNNTVKKMAAELKQCQLQMTSIKNTPIEKPKPVEVGIIKACQSDREKFQTQIKNKQQIIARLQKDIKQLKTEKTSISAMLASIFTTDKKTEVIPEDNKTITPKQLNDELKKEINAKKINIISQKDGAIDISIENDLIFKAGGIQILNSGVIILQKVARLLRSYPDRKIQIIGHTDNIPVRAGNYKPILSNWELSAIRAGAIIRYLQHGTKIAPQRMILLGASQYQPLEEGNNDSIRAKNRRIEIRLLANKRTSN